MSTWWQNYVKQDDQNTNVIDLSVDSKTIDLSTTCSGVSDSVSTSTSSRKRTRRSSTEVNRVRIEDKRAKMESTKRYTVALAEASKKWTISKNIQSDKEDMAKYNILSPNGMNDATQQSCQEICDEINITLEVSDKKITKTTLQRYLKKVSTLQ